MKRFLKVFLILILIMQFSVLAKASICISHYGKYQKNGITFSVNYTWGNGTPRMVKGKFVCHHFSEVTVKITSNKGYNIYNKTWFKFNDRKYYFIANNVKNYFYKHGEREFNKAHLGKVTYITLHYQLRKNPKSRYISTKTYVKKFKIIKPNTSSKRGNKLIITEIK